MPSGAEFRHLGGGRKGLFLLLRYLFIISASYLILFHASQPTVEPVQALMVAMALASNVGLGFMPSETLFAWYVEVPIIVADTLWVSWALSSTGAIGGDFFLLYVFVLFLSATGGNPLMVGLGSVLVSIANLYFVRHVAVLNTPVLLRVAFFFAVALFYGHVVAETRHERRRADAGLRWAKDLEAKVAERTADLHRLYSEAQAANAVKSEFVANISHELRTPLNIIMGYTEMLLDVDPTRDRAQHDHTLRRIQRSARALLDLVDSVLELGRLENARVEVHPAPVALGSFLDALRTTERHPTAPGVSVAWDVPDHLPEVSTDAGKLAVLLNNLVNNALKFTREGRVRVAARWIPDRDVVEFTIEDTGPGIEAGDLATIFEPFKQLDQTGRFGGVGLGLAIVQRHAALLGAEVLVDSEPGRGTTFLVRLPIAAPMPRAAAA